MNPPADEHGERRDWRPHRRPAVRLEVRVWRVAVLLALTLAVLFAVAVPRFPGGGGINANESAAIAVLKNVAAGQRQFRAQCEVDRDGDGVGEFGYFAELAGAVPLPGREVADRPAPPVLSPAFGRLRDGHVVRSGYRFQLFLPAHGGLWLAEAARGGRQGDAVSAQAAEQRWLAYAWPVVDGDTRGGARAFLCDQDGDVRAHGLARGAAFAPQPGVSGFRYDGASWVAAANTADVLGDVWVIVQ